VATILVIDDDPATQLVVRRVLERAGLAVITDAATAAPTLIVANIESPIESPETETLSAIRRRHPGARLLEISTAGAGRLTKPFTPSQLLAAVRLCLARQAMPADPI
jgi:hypothetical protein